MNVSQGCEDVICTKRGKLFRAKHTPAAMGKYFAVLA